MLFREGCRGPCRALSKRCKDVPVLGHDGWVCWKNVDKWEPGAVLSIYQFCIIIRKVLQGRYKSIYLVNTRGWVWITCRRYDYTPSPDTSESWGWLHEPQQWVVSYCDDIVAIFFKAIICGKCIDVWTKVWYFSGYHVCHAVRPRLPSSSFFFFFFLRWWMFVTCLRG